MQMLLNSIWALKESTDNLSTTGVQLDLGNFGDIAAIMGDPNDPDSYNADPQRALTFADIIHEIRAMRGIYRDKDEGILFFKRRHRMDPSTPLEDQFEQGPAFNPLDPSTWGYLVHGNKHPAWSPYHSAYASIEKMQGYQKGFFGAADPQAPMSLGELDESDFWKVVGKLNEGKEFVDNVRSLIPSFQWDLGLAELLRAGSSVSDMMRDMQLREESFGNTQRYRNYAQLMIVQLDQLLHELRQLQGVPAYQRSTDPGTLSQDSQGFPLAILRKLPWWDDLPQYVKDYFPFADNNLNPHYGYYILDEQKWQDAGSPGDQVHTWNVKDQNGLPTGQTVRTTQNPELAKFTQDAYSPPLAYIRSNIPALRGRRPDVVASGKTAFDWEDPDRATLQDILDRLGVQSVEDENDLWDKIKEILSTSADLTVLAGADTIETIIDNWRDLLSGRGASAGPQLLTTVGEIVSIADLRGRLPAGALPNGRELPQLTDIIDVTSLPAGDGASPLLPSGGGLAEWIGAAASAVDAGASTVDVVDDYVVFAADAGLDIANVALLGIILALIAGQSASQAAQTKALKDIGKYMYGPQLESPDEIQHLRDKLDGLATEMTNMKTQLANLNSFFSGT
jgi:hypothetical protein